MAIWQFSITFLPKEPLLKEFGEIPSRLSEDYWQLLDYENLEESDDPLRKFWHGHTLEFYESIIAELSNNYPEVEWLKEYKNSYGWGNTQTDDIYLSFEENQVTEFTGRNNLRQIDKKFISRILKISQEKDLVLVDRNGNIFEPQWESLLSRIKESDSFRFVENPRKFIENLGNKSL